MELNRKIDWKGITQRLAIFFIAVVILFAANQIGHGFDYVSIWSGATSFGLLYLGAMLLIVALRGRSIKTGIEMAILFVLILEVIVFGWSAWTYRDGTVVVFVLLFLAFYFISVQIYRRNYILQKKDKG